MIHLESRKTEEILAQVDPRGEVFFLGCSGWKEVCNPGGEARMQQLKKELILRGVSFIGTSVVDALCTKGMDELSLLTQFRQVSRVRFSSFPVK